MATKFCAGLQHKTRPVPIPDRVGQLAVQENRYAYPASGLSTNDVIVAGILPAGHVLVDAYVASDDLDEGVSPAMVLDVGLANKTVTEYNADPVNDLPSDIAAGKYLISGSTVAQGGGVARMASANFLDLGVDKAHDRFVLIKINTQAADAAAGDLALVLSYRPACWGE